MRRVRRTALLGALICIAIQLSFGQAMASGRGATLATFAGLWYGHTRSLTIDRNGLARESISDGCCHRLIDLQMHLYRPRGVVGNATVMVRVTWVHIHDTSFSPGYSPPRAAETARLRLRGGVITEPLTGTNYCDLAADMQGRCGA